ncbi:hypothetical protein INN71_07270 [Nocardioides sp. ChNu-153]|uniref:hypothetical protein n=1 Tax=unclassified Nocardioides TaxID=2615069 RepID=UPI002405B7B2|nr:MULTISPECIES: hypothetical protein [unclassified Nocardioides]MDF9717832.1 hypothetical protein [Nocardioides sp. ChNu-99]MDN7121190.1 hypothetical protein [Nocardioides sp. ChNu-153]
MQLVGPRAGDRWIARQVVLSGLWFLLPLALAAVGVSLIDGPPTWAELRAGAAPLAAAAGLGLLWGGFRASYWCRRLGDNTVDLAGDELVLCTRRGSQRLELARIRGARVDGRLRWFDFVQVPAGGEGPPRLRLFHDGELVMSEPLLIWGDRRAQHIQDLLRAETG